MTFVVLTIIIIIVITTMIMMFFFVPRLKENFDDLTQTHGLNKCDGFIYINLEERPDRKTEILDEFVKLDIPTNKIHKISGILMPENGHKGCVQAHILALNLARLNNWKYTFIFEDDAMLNVPVEKFKTDFTNALNAIDDIGLPKTVLHLGGCNVEYEALPSPNQYIKRLKTATCGTAYVIHQNYIPQLLNVFMDCNHNMNAHHLSNSLHNHEPFALDQKWNDLMKQDIWFSMSYMPFIQRASYSTTMGNLEKTKNRTTREIMINH